jgi:hypothetical protein
MDENRFQIPRMKPRRLKAPFPWFGGKSRVADLVWERFGEVPNYVEPFFGSGAVMLARPFPVATETVNDLDCFIANFWRAVQKDPKLVALWADWPVNEADLHARHLWLVKREEFRERIKADPSITTRKSPAGGFGASHAGLARAGVPGPNGRGESTELARRGA